MASAVAMLPLSKISTQVFFSLLQKVPRHYCRVEGIRRDWWACLLGMATQRACKARVVLWFPRLACQLAPCRAGPGTCGQEGRQAAGLLPSMARRYAYGEGSVWSYAGITLLLHEVHHHPCLKHSCVPVLGNAVITEWGRKQPCPWPNTLETVSE